MLLLGGTSEAQDLAARLAGVPTLRVVTSYAGRVRSPRRPDGDLRTGGFGGTDGLAAWLRANAPALVVDATHPFAVQISSHAVDAARATGIPLLRLQRPGWTPEPGDQWHRVPELSAAAALLPRLGSRPLLTTGRQGLAAFTGDPACARLDLFVRCVDPPEIALPPRTRLLRARGPYTVPGERALLLEHRIDVLVTKDSGGAATSAKLDAARELGLPVIIVDRPPAPAAPTVATVEEAERWVRDQRQG